MSGRFVNDEAFVARNSPVRIMLLAALSLGFVALGLWIVGAFGPAPEDAPRWAGWLAIVFFGAGFFIIVARLFGPSEQLRVDRQGICWAQWSDQTIPWSAIDDISQAKMHNQKFLCLHLRHPERYRSERLLGRVARANPALGFGDVTITVSGTDRSFAELLDAVDRFAPRASPF